ncbi:gamma-glutamyltransferase [Psychromarinibacter halotolerans]|uniref:Gamma-glutamyltransferase n=1 Tax=Psychromarinibacter halotolerans TaxID=1775175 RepID=A0ABV7GX16_9RHOB|nr:gamma-glutamyltransferase [Psychromarinibacter halotolerans]MDF0598498.1 gamma-glutamyltransferase [Psychromarinibacter halotolerans]
MSNFSTTQKITKTVEWTDGGVVASQHRTASEAGARVLAEGGNAFDAAVATAFALGVVEPWMSGPVGGGMMTLWRADRQQAETIEFGMRSPVGLRLEDYPLERGDGHSDLFTWTKVKDDRNVFGPHSIAVPGFVAGIEMLHQRHATRDWADLLAPSVGLAEKGMLIDWYASLMIAAVTRNLAQDPDAAAMFLVDGQWPNIAGWTDVSEQRLDQSAMAATLRQLAEAGARDFYEGRTAEALVADMAAKGSSLSAEDLSTYSAKASPTREIAYRGGVIHAPSGPSAGASLVRTFRQLAQSTFGDSPDAASFAATATALRDAYKARLSQDGAEDEPAGSESCTTTFSVVDKDGNMINVTQTLLSKFGSRVVSPSTGMLMNNGIMWFDPEPGRPNSLAPGKACLMNVCPTIGSTGDTMFAIGAAGGRKILPSVTNLASFMLDFGMSLEDAFHHPRIDVSGTERIIADEDLSPEIVEALSGVADTGTAKRTVHPYAFGVPAGVMRQNGRNCGATEIMSPWGDAILADDIA